MGQKVERTYSKLLERNSSISDGKPGQKPNFSIENFLQTNAIDCCL